MVGLLNLLTDLLKSTRAIKPSKPCANNVAVTALRYYTVNTHVLMF
jgi:hypothetical protein